MRVLYVSYFCNPETVVPRIFELSVRLARRGHEVTILTGLPNHPAGKLFPGYKWRPIQTERVQGVKIVRVGSIIAPNTTTLKRTSAYLSKAFAQLVASVFLGPADVVVGSSPPLFTGLPAWFASVVKRAPFCFEVRDLWPENMVAIGAMNNPLMLRTMRALERFLYARADKVIPVTEGFRDYIKDKGIPADKMEVVFNGVELDTFAPQPYPQDLAAELGLAGKFVVAYIGTIGINHGLQVLLDAGERLRDLPDVALLAVGDGAERELLTRQASERGLENVHFIGPRPQAEMPAFHSLADVLFAHLKKADYFRRVIPAKIFVAMAMSRPLILGAEGEAQRIVESAGAGVAVEPENPDALAGEIRRLYAMRGSQEFQVMGQRGRAFVAEHFDRDRLAEQFEKALLSVAKNGGK